ncbi:SDR family oxidoreductase [Microbacterium sp. EYE_5]|uniref:SDR family oxidoreductase n=1 Tax=unclassified Microbacterium TaxID=2609290 RepID=UPI0020057897|nr:MULTISPECIES: SDR family oxidoreductase [unclassified Microbacterium]MCK6081421.1 SDR family oxidoreductase [Microbacterium sp. EYE_382]MCK6086691.1 SDR family oxidoreductase [Microbacterium sp. EYE_384]MCK6123811.1 SDR family oxidoreductase [Microbacterium sp. EYE_80]MCK6126720.1 SDR family oxidoreductase [Microbacterium sp. EYE_79]MCK6142376.1 SDR family oxidoreductase [Microbacterium sp. EYE_39]
MARILLIGGHGKVALLLSPLLVEAGHHVTSVFRNPAHEEEVAATGATPLVADVEGFDLGQFTNLVSGNDVVVWSAGAGGGDPQRTWAVDRDAAIRSIEAAEAAGVPRYVMVSYFGAGADHGVDPEDAFFAYAEAKAAADERLRTSGLDWTILAPSALTLDEPTGRIDADAEQGESVSRADVAAVIAATVDDATTVRRTISFNAGQTPIAEAIRG